MGFNEPWVQMPLNYKWRHNPTTVYTRNYNYGINYYQPLIDYIDRKESGSRNVKPPELPWSDGRGVWEHGYVVPYSKEELAHHALNAEYKAKEHLEHFKVM